MFAVIKTQSNDVVEGCGYCCFLSDDETLALKFIDERKSLSSNGRYKSHEISSLEELKSLVSPEEIKEVVNPQEILQNLIEKLQSLEIDEKSKKLMEEIEIKGKKVLAETASLGKTGINYLAEEIISIGNAIKSSVK